MKTAAAFLLLSGALSLLHAKPAAEAVNAFGLDLCRAAPRAGQVNEVLSPFSLSYALALAMSGAGGQTQQEFEKVLHLSGREAGELTGLRRALGSSLKEAQESARETTQNGFRTDATAFHMASRLYAQQGFSFQESFLDNAAEKWLSPLEPLDFQNGRGAEKTINAWVSQQTGGKITHLIPGNSLRPGTSLVMVNAVYFKAPWADEFEERLTKPQRFHRAGGPAVQVPFMYQGAHFGYLQGRDYEAVSLPYYEGEFQFTVVLPSAPDGLGKLLATLTPAELTEMKDLPTETKVKLHLPKLRLAPASASLGSRLQGLGLRSAFDQPQGSADFSGIAERTPARYLALRECYHRTFLNLDERGTQAVSASALSADPFGAPEKKPAEVEVRVDRPFVFAIQHRKSGVCLFLGVVADPR